MARGRLEKQLEAIEMLKSLGATGGSRAGSAEGAHRSE